MLQTNEESKLTVKTTWDLIYLRLGISDLEQHVVSQPTCSPLNLRVNRFLIHIMKQSRWFKHSWPIFWSFADKIRNQFTFHTRVLKIWQIWCPAQGEVICPGDWDYMLPDTLPVYGQSGHCLTSKPHNWLTAWPEWSLRPTIRHLPHPHNGQATGLFKETCKELHFNKTSVMLLWNE